MKKVWDEHHGIGGTMWSARSAGCSIQILRLNTMKRLYIVRVMKNSWTMERGRFRLSDAKLSAMKMAELIGKMPNV